MGWNHQRVIDRYIIPIKNTPFPPALSVTGRSPSLFGHWKKPMAFRGNWPPKYRMMSTFWRSQPLLICLKKTEDFMEEKVMRSCCVKLCWKKVVVSKDHSFENIKKRRGILGDFFPLFWKIRWSLTIWEGKNWTRPGGSETIQADVLGQRPFKGVSKNRGYPHFTPLLMIIF